MSPQEFQDVKGRTFRAAVSLTTAARLREIGFDVNKMGEPDFWVRLAEDPELLGKVLWLMVEPSATVQGVTPEDFGNSLEGDAIYAASQAMREALLSFCQPGVRPALRNLLEKGKAAQQIAIEQLANEVEKLTPEQILTLSNSGTNSPGS